MAKKAQIIPPSMTLKRRAVNSKKGFDTSPKPEDLRKIEEVVNSSADKFITVIAGTLRALRGAITLAENDPPMRDMVLVEVRERAFDLKGLGGTYKFPLLSEIGRSLHGLTAQMTQINDVQLAIIKYHVDALYVVVAQKIQGVGGTVEQELIVAFRKAVEKFG